MKKILLISMMLILFSVSVNAFYINESFDNPSFGSNWTIVNGAGSVTLDTNRLKMVGSATTYACFNITGNTGALSGVYNISYTVNPSQTNQRFQMGGWNNNNGADSGKRNSVLFVRDNANFQLPYGTNIKAYSSGVTYNVTHVVNETAQTYEVWIDGALEKGTTAFSNALATNNYCLFGWDTGTFYIDSIIINNESLAPVIILNDSVESTAVVKQIGSVDINTPAFQTVFTSDFNVTVNNSDLYGTYSFNVEANLNNDLECQLLIDSNNVANVSRSNIAGELGSVFLMSSIFNLTSGTHNQELSCRKIGAGKFTISNSIGIGHFMVDEFNNTIPHDSISGSANVTSGSTFTEIAELNFTISDRPSDNSILKHLIIEWSSDYINNYISTENLSTYISINNTNCSFYPRTVGSGNTGSVSGDCLIENVTTNATYNIKFYGNGNNATYTNGVLIAKEFILSDIEIAGGQGALVGTTFSGDQDVQLFNLTGGNINHALTNVFEKQAYSILTNESTTVTMYITLNNSVHLRTVDMVRDFEPNVLGVLIGQDIFENVPQDNYILSVYANCGSPTASCELVGGAGIGYLTDVTTTLSNAFDIYSYDNYDNSSILNFTAIDGASFSTTTGHVVFFTNEFFENITITSDFNGGYFPLTVLNHNTSELLNITLNQTLIGWNCSEKISNVDIACNSSLESTIFNYNVIGNPYNQIFNSTNYLDLSYNFNVTALQNETIVVGLYTSNLTINSTSSVGNVSTCSYELTGITYPSYSETITGSPLGSVGLINGTYNVFANCFGFSTQSQNVTINSTIQNITFSLFGVNSMLFTLYNRSDFTLLTGTNISIFLHGSTIDYSDTTTTASLYFGGLDSDTYEITITSAVTDPTILYGTLTGGEFLNFEVYLQSGLVNKDFIVKDTRGNVVADVILTFTQIINGSEITIGQATTDFSGRASIFLSASQNYNLFAVKTGFDTFTGSVTPTQNEYSIVMTETGIERFISVFEDVNYFAGLDYIAGNNFAIPYLIINSIDGSLQYYGFNTTYNNTLYLINNTGTPAGGIEELNITPLLDNERFLTVTYFFKSIGYDVITWDVPYILINTTPTNITYSDGLFDDIQALEEFNPVRVGIAMFIIILLVLMFGYGSSKDFSAMVIGAMLGLGTSYLFELLPGKLTTVALITLGVILVADNVGGRR